MLANLDNEVHFKKVFTDIEVFLCFRKRRFGCRYANYKGRN